MSVKYEFLKCLVKAAGIKKLWISKSTEELLENRRRQNAEAKKGECPANLTFEVADAMKLPYKDDSFDAVLIANALHIVPDPKQVLREIDRVLRPGGLLIAPNFVEHKGTLGSRLWSGILMLAGVRFEHQWSSQEYLYFLEDTGWHVVFSREMAARIAMMYTECERK